jgi:hypothetical protein
MVAEPEMRLNTTYVPSTTLDGNGKVTVELDAAVTL